MACRKIEMAWALEHLWSPSFPSQWTYGCELELSDWDRSVELPVKGMLIDPDWTMVNSNGIAVDPTGVTYPFGGEICTVPTETIGGQVEQLETIRQVFPRVTVNYRSNLHVHVRVPGLRSDLKNLKRVLAFNQLWLPQVLDVIEPIPEPQPEDYPLARCYAGARRRYRRRIQSHHYLPTKLADRQMEARTPREFFTLGVPTNSRGEPMWGVAQREAVNLKQLLQTDTIEFRHFPGTLNSNELEASIEWCRNWMEMALGLRQETPLELRRGTFPKFEPYNHDMEVKYRATAHDGTVPLEDIQKYQLQILFRQFRGSPYYA